MAISEKLVKINEEVVTQEDLLAQIQAALEGKGSGGESTSHTLSMQKITVKESSYLNQDTEGELQTITISNVSKEPTFFALIRAYNGYLQSIDGVRRYVLAVIYNKDGNPNGTYKIDYIYSLVQSSTRYTSTGYNTNEDGASVRIIYDESNSQVQITAAYPYTLAQSDYYCYMLAESTFSEFEQSLLGGAS